MNLPSTCERPILPPELRRLWATVQDPLPPSCPSSVSTKIISQLLVQKLYPKATRLLNYFAAHARMVLPVHNLRPARRSPNLTSTATKISSFPSHPRVVGTGEGGHHQITVLVQRQCQITPVLPRARSQLLLPLK